MRITLANASVLYEIDSDDGLKVAVSITLHKPDVLVDGSFAGEVILEHLPKLLEVSRHAYQEWIAQRFTMPLDDIEGSIEVKFCYHQVLDVNTYVDRLCRAIRELVEFLTGDNTEDYWQERFTTANAVDQGAA